MRSFPVGPLYLTDNPVQFNPAESRLREIHPGLGPGSRLGNGAERTVGKKEDEQKSRKKDKGNHKKDEKSRFDHSTFLPE
ncbi:MAG: hypothetical protein IJ088_05370 [Clostridia bacterium]|nr:hypothetical protein [Clostridia bacterium]